MVLWYNFRMAFREKQIEQLPEIYAVYNEWDKSEKDYHCFKKATEKLKEFINNANGKKHNLKPYVARYFLCLGLYFCLFIGVSSIIDSSGNLLPVNFVLSVLFAYQNHHNRWNDDMLVLTEFVVECLRFSNIIQDEYFKTIYRENRPIFVSYKAYNKKKRDKRRLLNTIIAEIREMFNLAKRGSQQYSTIEWTTRTMDYYAKNYNKDNIGKYGERPYISDFLKDEDAVIELIRCQNYYGVIFDRKLYSDMFEYVEKNSKISTEELMELKQICQKVWDNCQ